MSTPVTILGTTILFPTQGDVDYSNETTKFANFTAAALAPIQGLITNPTGFTAYLSVDIDSHLTVTIDGVTTVIDPGVTSFNTRTGAITLTSLDVTDALGYIPGTGNPAGPTGSIQYNDGGALAGSAKFTFADGISFSTVGFENGTLASYNVLNGSFVLKANAASTTTTDGRALSLVSGDGGAASGSGGSIAIVSGNGVGAGKNSGNINILAGTASSGATRGTITLDASTTVLSSSLTANSSVGTAGQILTSRGVGLSPEWSAAPATGVTSFNTRTGAVTLTSLDVTDALGYTPGSGSGTVTDVSVVANNGITSSVTNSTTTPEITLGLGDITPTSVAAQGGNITLVNNTGTVYFQAPFESAAAIRTSTTNQNTSIPIVPNGTGSASKLTLWTGSTQLGRRLYFDVDTAFAAATIGSGSTSGTSAYNLKLIASTFGSGINSNIILNVDGTISVHGATTFDSAIAATNFSGNSSGTNTGDQTLNSLLPSQTGNNGKYLTTDGTNASWGTVATGGGSLSDLTAATANNSILNTTYAQEWGFTPNATQYYGLRLKDTTSGTASGGALLWLQGASVAGNYELLVTNDVGTEILSTQNGSILAKATNTFSAGYSSGSLVNYVSADVGGVSLIGGSTSFQINASGQLVISTVTGATGQLLTSSGGVPTWSDPATAYSTSSTTAPATPKDGDIWIDENTGIQYTYVDDGDSTQWVQFGTGNVPTDLSITSLTTTSNVNIGNDIVLPNAAGHGIKLDNDTPAFGWADLIGPINVRGGGAADPAWAVFRTNINAYQFGVNDECWLTFHVPHDYVPGSDMFLHVHWAHNSASVTTGAVTFTANSTFAKGFDQEAFPATKTITITQNASTVQYQHMVAESQLSSAGGSATLLDSNTIEVDGLILVRLFLSANTISAATDPFVFTADIHYQSTGFISTKNKAPNFYS